jgi:pyroglutamyl-peptidase
VPFAAADLHALHRTVSTILITGFGPFPGAPFNPTEALVAELARGRRPTSLRRVAHVFRVSYAAIDRELPVLLQRENPDAVLMFGLAARTPHLRIETCARNAVAQMLPDADRHRPRNGRILAAGPAAVGLRNPAARLLRAAQLAGVPSVLSRNAGSYLCNYLCWHAAQAARRGSPRIIAFVHVPAVARAQSSFPRRSRTTPDDLVRAGEAMIRAMIPLMRLPA